MHQYKYIPHDSNDLNSNTQTTNLNSIATQLSFTIKRKRSLTSLNHNKTLSLQKINKTPSPKHLSKYPSLSSSTTQKDKSCYLKSNLIQQKFHQLSLKPTLKTPLKLKISKMSNQQENHLLKQHFSNFSKQMENKFQTQNNILKNSLQKIQNLVADNRKLPEIYQHPKLIQNHSDPQVTQQNTNQRIENESFKHNKNLMANKEIVSCSKQKQIKKIDKKASKYRNKKIANGVNQSNIQKNLGYEQFQQTNQKLNQVINKNQQLKNHITKLIEQNNNLNAQIQQIKAQNSKIVDELKETKTINNFLVTQNYKLSLEISLLKNKITEYEQQKEQKESKKTAFNDQAIKSYVSLKKQQTLNQLSQKLLKSTLKSTDKKQGQDEDLISQQNILFKQIKTQNFSLLNKQFEDSQSQQSFINLKGDKENLNLRADINNNSECNIEKLLQKINFLEQELNQQKDINQDLSNKLAALKLKYHGVKCQEKDYDKENTSLDSAVSIKIHLQQEDPQLQVENLSKTAEFHQSQQKMTKPKISIQNIPHRSSKSSILSNKFIYFAQLFGNPQQANPVLNQTKQSEHQQIINQNLNKQQKNSFLQTINEEDEIEKKKTLCMKKLQTPVEQVRKKKKDMTQLIKMSLQKKVTPNHNSNNTLSFYSKLKIFQLQNIKQTISLKFEAFKYTFELFQNQMMLWPKKTATSQDLKSILSEYPFLLEGSSIDLLLPYLGVSETGGISVDIFCNKMREFIGQYNELSEQEELVLEKKIFKRWRYTSQEILQSMSKAEIGSGEIRKQQFCTILEEFKFQASEIHRLLSQSVAISPDLNRIKYKHYLDNFLAKN